MTSQEQIVQAIQNYLESDRPNAALLINGEWGAGKTYFWKNTIVPLLEDTSRHHVYVSLYGVSSHSEIEQQVMYGIFPFLDSKIFRLGRFIGELRGYRVPPIKYVPKLHRAVFCFDDLERSAINVADALGYINRFIEQYGSHVLILANESQITDEKYPTVKEKVIGKTFAMKPDIEAALSNIWNALDNKAKQLDKHWLSIQRVIASCEPINLRSAIQAVDNCNLVLHRLEKHAVLEVGVIESVMVMTGALTMESKVNGELLAHLKGLFCDPQTVMFAAYSRQDDGSKSDLLEQLDRFAARYFEGNIDNIPPLKSILEFIESGWIDIEAVHAEALAISPAESSEHADPKEAFLHDIWSLTDRQIIDIAQTYIRDVSARQITQAELLARIFITLVFIAKHQVIEQTPGQLLEIFVKAIDQLSRENRFCERDLGGWDASHLFYGPVDAEARRLFDALNLARDKFMASQHQERLRTLLNEFDTDYETFLQRMAGAIEKDHFDYPHRPVLAELEGKTLANILASKDARDIQYFSRLLNQRYNRVANIADFLNEESVVLADLAIQLREKLPSIGPGMKRVALGRVIEGLEQASKKLRPLNSPAEN